MAATMEFADVAVIEVRDLTKRYRGRRQPAVEGLDLDVLEGQLFCLLGPNGAGKTTTLSILTTTLVPTGGAARIAGHDLIKDQSRVRAAIGVVFQGHSLDLNLTAEENVRLHAVLYGLYPWRPLYRLMSRAYRQQLDGLATILGLADVLGKPARTLSGGMRRKLEIVRALMHRPRVLFLDEPTAGLDPESRRSLWAYLNEVRDRHGITVFLTTHYLQEAEVADAVCVLLGGRRIEFGSPDSLKAQLTRRELVVDAADRASLRSELAAMQLTFGGDGPIRVQLDHHNAQSVIRAIRSELNVLRLIEPSLEDAYLMLLEREEP